MKSVGGRAQERKELHEIEIGYEAVKANTANIMAQGEAVMLYALSLHGYDKDQIKEIHGWYCSLLRMPGNMMGKTPKMPDVQALVSERYGVDFGEVKPQMPDFKQFCKDNDLKMR